MRRLSASLAVGVLVLALSAPGVSQAAVPAGFKSVAYATTSGGTAASIPYAKLTHVNYSFVRPNADGSLQPLANTAKLNQIVQLARPRGVKVLIAVGGWMNGDDSAFETLASSPAGRSRHIQALVDLVARHGVDGIDMDWEYPEPGQSANQYTLLMRDLSTALHSRGKLLTAAVSSKNQGLGIQTLVFGYVDFLNIMTYDGGSPHANLDWTIDAVNWWKGRGLPKAKAVVGVPLYSRPGNLTFADLVARNAANANRDCAVINGVNECWNGLPTLRAKTRWALANAGGIMNWQIAMDATGANSAVSAIYDTAGG